MNVNEYQKLALRTEAPKDLHMHCKTVIRAFANLGAVSDPSEDLSIVRLLEGLLGLNGEAGEASDILKKALFQGHLLDREHMAKELGDVAWYLALAADAIGYDLESILQMNIEKLKSRYPDGFRVDLSVNRKGSDV